MATVECRGIRKVYGSLEVMRDFDLKIDNHEFVVFLDRQAAENPPCCA